ncbi:MAG: hypothetical protein EP330_22145 [Deltaproteobacteria bacterium]|nr:MAG: hypothetical protein EP330_22145 [Deltaproteobacteria bacterium]
MNLLSCSWLHGPDLRVSAFRRLSRDGGDGRGERCWASRTAYRFTAARLEDGWRLGAEEFTREITEQPPPSATASITEIVNYLHDIVLDFDIDDEGQVLGVHGGDVLREHFLSPAVRANAHPDVLAALETVLADTQLVRFHQGLWNAWCAAWEDLPLEPEREDVVEWTDETDYGPVPWDVSRRLVRDVQGVVELRQIARPRSEAMSEALDRLPTEPVRHLEHRESSELSARLVRDTMRPIEVRSRTWSEKQLWSPEHGVRLVRDETEVAWSFERIAQ